MADEPKITRVLWWSDFGSTTGYASVANNVLKYLANTGEFEITIVGIGYYGDPLDWTGWKNIPLVIPASAIRLSHIEKYNDQMGRQRVLDLLETGGFDLFMCLTDPFNGLDGWGNYGEFSQSVDIIRKKNRKSGTPFKWIWYYPVDATPKSDWIRKSIAYADVPLAMSNYGVEETKKIDGSVHPKIIYHGVDTKTFFPINNQARNDFRKQFFGDNKDKFIVANINRNIFRKNLPATIAAFAEFHKTKPKSFLYLHCDIMDLGGNFTQVAKEYGLEIGKDYGFPNQMKWDMGTSMNMLNLIYNASDAVISTTLGEGFGLTTLEAMACKVPVVMPFHTALKEISRGPFYEPEEAKVNYGHTDYFMWRPVMDPHALAERLASPDLNEYVEANYEFAKALDWENIMPQWYELIKRTCK